MWIRLLLLGLLYAATPALAQSPADFTLPGIADLEKQLAGDGGGDNNGGGQNGESGQDNPEHRETLEKTLELRREIDANRERIDALKKQQAEAPRRRARLGNDLDEARRERQQDWRQRYQSLSLAALAKELSDQLDALEQNQQTLARVSSELTRAQTLPERAQTTISDSLSRMDEIRQRLNRQEENLDDAEKTRLQTELTTLETRIQLRNQELSVASTLEELSRLNKRVLEAQEAVIQKRLDVLQPMINERREQSLSNEIGDDETDLPAALADHPRLKQARERNDELRDQLKQTSNDVNDLIREVISAETRLDRARSLSSTVNDQIRMLDGSLLLSRILYEQQKSLPEYHPQEGLDKLISDTRLAQFDLRQAMQELESRPLEVENTDELPPAERQQLDDALRRLADSRLELLNQLDQELGRKLNILVRLNLSQEQLRKITENLHDTISEQTFWMPSTQPLPAWIRDFPTQVRDQVHDIPWARLGDDAAELMKNKWPWLFLPLLLAGLLWLWRRRLRARLRALNGDIGFLKRDSQRHTPAAIVITTLVSAPVPLAIGLLAWGLWTQPGTLSTVLGAALAKIALLWMVFELCYRLLAPKGIAQRHFRWQAEGNLVLRRRLLVVGLTMVPMTLVIAFGEEWPAQLSNDRIGLVTMVACLLVISVTLSRAALAYRARRYSRTLRGAAVVLCAGVPLILVALIVAGYYFTAVRLSGRMIDTFYLSLLWILLDATAVRGLAVAAQRLAYKRAVAERDAEPKENVEGVEVEEPQLDLQQINQQSLRLIRLALLGLFGLLLYWVWADVINAFSYTDTIVLWQSTEGSGLNATNTPISLGDVITSLAIGAGTFMLVANLPGLLEVLLLSRLNLRQGSSYAVTTLLSYLVIVLGVIVALGSLGLSWSKMQWLVAALGVGLGFGLQEIFANFISGIIILFERPIRIGDVITIENLSGTVSRIRIRATTIIDFDRKEIVIPNKVFVTERLINWTLSDTITRLTIKVGFAYGSDLTVCHDLLEKVARDNTRVLSDPEPLILFMAFGASTLDHELRVYLGEIGDILFATDEINKAIDAACREHGVEIAFNQIDVHLRSTTDDVKILEAGGEPADAEQRRGGDTRGHYGNTRSHYHDGDEPPKGVGDEGEE
ncbi:mechanosensitive channel MscK [Alloalcanivorax marinus]|uniref:mechanosensitive channel MscK n=1 Tax=Alloalcanivorax marinus TaxID=1177169 RepID=UPI003083416A